MTDLEKLRGQVQRVADAYAQLISVIEEMSRQAEEEAAVRLAGWHADPWHQGFAYGEGFAMHRTARALSTLATAAHIRRRRDPEREPTADCRSAAETPDTFPRTSTDDPPAEQSAPTPEPASAIAFIPARGGSRRVPMKALAQVGSQSLLERAILVARAVGADPVVSTDHEAIAAEARRLGARVHDRPAELATDDAQIEGAVLHWIDQERPDPKTHILLLQPDRPFRRQETVAKALRLSRDSGRPVATAEAIRGIEELGFEITSTGASPCRPLGEPRPRSQEMVPRWRERGVCWAATVAHWIEARDRLGLGMTLVEVDRVESLGIDTPADLDLARAVARGLG